MRIAVSACLLGVACKYNGGDNLNEHVVRVLEGHEVVPICPEQLGGLSTPRQRSEIRDAEVVNEFGESVDAAFRAGARRAWEQIERAGGCDAAVLQPRSPSCGVGTVYDGSFSGVLVAGDGIFAQLLQAHNVPVFTPDQFLDACVRQAAPGL